MIIADFTYLWRLANRDTTMANLKLLLVECLQVSRRSGRRISIVVALLLLICLELLLALVAAADHLVLLVRTASHRGCLSKRGWLGFTIKRLLLFLEVSRLRLTVW